MRQALLIVLHHAAQPTHTPATPTSAVWLNLRSGLTPRLHRTSNSQLASAHTYTPPPLYYTHLQPCTVTAPTRTPPRAHGAQSELKGPLSRPQSSCTTSDTTTRVSGVMKPDTLTGAATPPEAMHGAVASHSARTCCAASASLWNRICLHPDTRCEHREVGHSTQHTARHGSGRHTTQAEPARTRTRRACHAGRSAPPLTQTGAQAVAAMRCVGTGAHLYRGTTSRLSPSNVGRAGGNARRPAAWCMHAAASCAEPSSSTSVLWLDVMHCGQGWHTVRGALSSPPSHENQIPRSALNGTRSSACTPPAQAQHAQRTARSAHSTLNTSTRRGPGRLTARVRTGARVDASKASLL